MRAQNWWGEGGGGLESVIEDIPDFEGSDLVIDIIQQQVFTSSRTTKVKERPEVTSLSQSVQPSFAQEEVGESKAVIDKGRDEQGVTNQQYGQPEQPPEKQEIEDELPPLPSPMAVLEEEALRPKSRNRFPKPVEKGEVVASEARKKEVIPPIQEMPSMPMTSSDFISSLDPSLYPRHVSADSWVVFSDLHVCFQTLPTCLQVLAAVHDSAVARNAGIMFLGDFWHIRGTNMGTSFSI